MLNLIVPFKNKSQKPVYLDVPGSQDQWLQKRVTTHL